MARATALGFKRPTSNHFKSVLTALVGCFLTISLYLYYFSVSKRVYVTKQKQDKKENWACTWSPTTHGECHYLLHSRLPLPTLQPELSGAGHDKEISPVDVERQRWLFFGDSTMKRLFFLSNLKTVLRDDPLKMSSVGCLGQVTCIQKNGERCKLNDPFGLTYAEKWIPPDPHMFSGPIVFGAGNPYCSDCAGCYSSFLQCLPLVSIHNGTTSLINKQSYAGSTECDAGKMKYQYGGYISMEFARDAEIQTPEFQTTQENIAAFIDGVWNTPNMVAEWGKPICVLGAGIHDAMIKNITTEDYVRNVKFMLANFVRVCGHMIWLGNTSNMKDEERFLQTKALMRLWDGAVKEMIEAEPAFHNITSFIDVHNASLTWPHRDHIHMENHWYEKLGNELITPMILHRSSHPV